jgi:hypothetical protein
MAITRRSQSQPVSTSDYDTKTEDLLRYLGIDASHPMAAQVEKIVAGVAGSRTPGYSPVNMSEAGASGGTTPEGGTERPAFEVVKPDPDRGFFEPGGHMGATFSTIGSWVGGLFGGEEKPPEPPSVPYWWEREASFGTDDFNRKLTWLREQPKNWIPEYRDLPAGAAWVDPNDRTQGYYTAEMMSRPVQQRIPTGGAGQATYSMATMDLIEKYLTQLNNGELLGGDAPGMDLERQRLATELYMLAELAVNGVDAGQSDRALAEQIKKMAGDDEETAAALSALAGGESKRGPGSQANEAVVSQALNALMNRTKKVQQRSPDGGVTSTHTEPGAHYIQQHRTAETQAYQQSSDEYLFNTIIAPETKQWNAITDRRGILLAAQTVFRSVVNSVPPGTPVDIQQVERLFDRAWRVSNPGRIIGPQTRQYLSEVFQGSAAEHDQSQGRRPVSAHMGQPSVRGTRSATAPPVATPALPAPVAPLGPPRG